MSRRLWINPVAGGTTTTGTLADNDAADVFAFAGANGAGGVAALLDAADSFSFAGFGDVAGTMALAEAVDAFVASGAGAIVRTLAVKIAPFFSTDTITTPGYQLYRFVSGSLAADGSHVTSGISPITNVSNGYVVGLDASKMTLDANGGYHGIIVWDSGGGSPFYVADEISIGGNVTIDGTAAVPTTGNTANTINDCLNAARAEGFGKRVKSGTSLTAYAPDGTTAVRTFTLDDAVNPTQRT